MYTELAVLIGHVASSEPVGELAAVHHGVVVGDHDALGGAGGPARVGDVGEVLFGIELDRRRLRLVLREQGGEVDGPLGQGKLLEQLGRRVDGRIAVRQAHDDGPLHRRLRERLLGHGEEQVQPYVRLCPRVVKLEDELPLGQQWAHGNEDGPGFQEAVVRDGELRAVRQVDRDPVTLFHPHGRQSRREPVG